MARPRPAPFETEAEDLLTAVNVLRRQSKYHARLSSPDQRLTTAQVELLRTVADHPDITVASAAAELHLSANTVSTLVGQLSRMDLLERRYAEEDRRVVHLHTSEAAVKRMAGWRSRRARAVSAAMEQLSATDRKRLQQALPTLRQLGAELSASLVDQRDGVAAGAR